MDAVSHLVEDSQLRDEPVSGETDDDLDWRSLSSSLTSRIIFFSYFDWRSVSSSLTSISCWSENLYEIFTGTWNTSTQITSRRPKSSWKSWPGFRSRKTQRKLHILMEAQCNLQSQPYKRKLWGEVCFAWDWPEGSGKHGLLSGFEEKACRSSDPAAAWTSKWCAYHQLKTVSSIQWAFSRLTTTVNIRQKKLL